MKKILIGAAILMLGSCSENKTVSLGSTTIQTEVTPSFFGDGLGRAE